MTLAAEIHLFEQFDQRILFDIARMKYYRLDAISYCMLRELEQQRAITPELRHRWQLAYGGETAGQLVDEFTAMGLFQAPDDLTVQGSTVRNEDWNAVSLDVTQQCNLSCKYCYARPKHDAARTGVMSWDVARQALETLSGEKIWIVRFSGGEPLLNLALIKQCVAFVQDRAIKHHARARFQLITNGLLIDADTAAYLQQQHIQTAVSIDGDESSHDQARITDTGARSHRLVMDGIARLQSAGMSPISLNLVLGKHQRDLVSSVRFLGGLSPRDISIMLSEQAQEGWNIIDDDPAFALEQFQRLAREWIAWRQDGPTPVDAMFTGTALSILGQEKRSSPCQAGITYFAVGPDGRRYPCHSMVGKPELARTAEDMHWPDFCALDIAAIPQCRSCWLRHLCAGGCPGANYHDTGCIAGSSPRKCRVNRAMADISLAAYAALPEHIRTEIAITELKGQRRSRNARG